MKKNMLLVLLSATFTFCASAQGLVESSILHTPVSLGELPENLDSRNSEVFIHYGIAEEILYGSSAYGRYIWRMNTNYTEQDSSIKYMAATFPTIIDTLSDPSSEIPWENVVDATLESVYIRAGHRNISTLNDTLRVTVVGLFNGRPVGQILYTEDIVSSDSSIVGGLTWLNSNYLTVQPNIQVNGPFGVIVEYFGHPLDTFGLTAGYAYSGVCAPSGANFVIESLFTPNTYRFYTQYASFGLLPTSTGNDLYYECNGQSGYQEGQDSRHFMQNLDVGVNLTNIIDNISVNELPAHVGHVDRIFPNPVAGSFQMDVFLKGDSEVSIRVLNAVGSTVDAHSGVYYASGQHAFTFDASSWAPGIYTIDLEVDGYHHFQRVVNK